MTDMIERGTEAVDAFIGDKETSRAIFIEVLKAMREPTKIMIEAGKGQYDFPEDVWIVMIDAALGDKK